MIVNESFYMESDFIGRSDQEVSDLRILRFDVVTSITWWNICLFVVKEVHALFTGERAHVVSRVRTVWICTKDLCLKKRWKRLPLFILPNTFLFWGVGRVVGMFAKIRRSLTSWVWSWTSVFYGHVITSPHPNSDDIFSPECWALAILLNAFRWNFEFIFPFQ
jgi:hypothetical protein